MDGSKMVTVSYIQEETTTNKKFNFAALAGSSKVILYIQGMSQLKWHQEMNVQVILLSI